jgi:hypothetical protein
MNYILMFQKELLHAGDMDWESNEDIRKSVMVQLRKCLSEKNYGDVIGLSIQEK